NTAAGAGVDHMPGHTVERLPGLDAAALYQRFLAERPKKPMIRPIAAEFPAAFEKVYADEMDWRNGRGGPTEEEVRAVAGASGEECDDWVVDATRAMLGQQALQELEKALRRRFREQSGMPREEWDRVRRRLVVVHDRLTREGLAAKLARWV